MELARQLGDHPAEASYPISFGLTHINVHNNDQVVEVFEQELDITRKLEDREDERNALQQLIKAIVEVRALEQTK